MTAFLSLSMAGRESVTRPSPYSRRAGREFDKSYKKSFRPTSSNTEHSADAALKRRPFAAVEKVHTGNTPLPVVERPFHGRVKAESEASTQR